VSIVLRVAGPIGMARGGGGATSRVRVRVRARVGLLAWPRLSTSPPSPPCELAELGLGLGLGSGNVAGSIPCARNCC
jgi:hypothetical protein